MSTLSLKVEAFAGTTIEEACRDLCALADRVGILCELEFNGVKVWAYPGTDPAQLVKAWGEQMERPAHVYKIASARPRGAVPSAEALRLVPVELNDAMLNAGREALHLGAPLYNGHTVLRVWRAILDATGMTTCARSHPHENMSSECERLTVIAREQNAAARGMAIPAVPGTDVCQKCNNTGEVNGTRCSRCMGLSRTYGTTTTDPKS